MKRYLTACWIAITKDWLDFVKDDSVCGNGVQIYIYGQILIAKYFFYLIIRALFALLFPITAFIVLRMNRYKL